MLSAILLFSIQPVVSRIILPTLGGSTSVWTVSMMFFQFMLLFGYVWAHIMNRYLPIWMPPIIQAAIAAIGIMFISLNPSSNLSFTAMDNPILWQLWTLFCMIGLPYFMLATNAPLYQSIYQNFSSQTEIKSAYSLYSYSNIGSLAALIAYPFILDPLLGLDNHIILWKSGYIMLCCIIIISAILSLWTCIKHSPFSHDKASTGKSTNIKVSDISFMTLLMWCLYAFIPSALLLSLTNHITTDIASTPLLWIIPLAIYILSFVLTFSDKPLAILSNSKRLYSLSAIFSVLSICLLIIGTPYFIWFQVVIHNITFFFVVMLCHFQLYLRRPHADILTFFYIFIAFAGFLGGAAKVFLFPQIFVVPLEYGILLCGFVILLIFDTHNYITEKNIKNNFIIYSLIIAFGIILIFTFKFETIYVSLLSLIFLLSVVFNNYKKPFFIIYIALTASYVISKQPFGDDTLNYSRNSYGTLIVEKSSIDNTTAHLLHHGTTLHGIQSFGKNETTPLSYYHRSGPLGDIFDVIKNKQDKLVAALGLGVGTVACYGDSQTQFNFYEINPDIIALAKDPQYFTYLSLCAPDAPIFIGDARLKIAEQKDSIYDFILVDTFSSDSIPTHIMTKEAIEQYLKTLKQDGLIAFHVSNRYFDLIPVITSIANDLNLTSAYLKDKKNREDYYLEGTPSQYIIIERNKNYTRTLINNHNWKTYDGDLPKPWSDNHVNIFSAIKFFN